MNNQRYDRDQHVRATAKPARVKTAKSRATLASGQLRPANAAN